MYLLSVDTWRSPSEDSPKLYTGFSLFLSSLICFGALLHKESPHRNPNRKNKCSNLFKHTDMKLKLKLSKKTKDKENYEIKHEKEHQTNENTTHRKRPVLVICPPRGVAADEGHRDREITALLISVYIYIYIYICIHMYIYI